MARKNTSPPPDNSEQTETDSFDAVEFVVKAFNRSWEYAASNYHKSWEDAWKLYNNKRTKIGYVGITDTFVPMTFSTIETLVSALAGSKPSFNFIPPHDKQDQNTDVLNALLDYYWDKDQWNIKVISWVRGCLLNGTGVVYLIWDENHPCMINVPIRDFIIDPTATDIESADYIGRRYLTTLEELQSFEVTDPATGNQTPRFKNLDQIKSTDKTNDESTDKQTKDMFYGSTVSDAEETQIEVIELYHDNKIYSVANRAVEIESAESPHFTQAKKLNPNANKGLIPYAIQRNYIDESLFYGKSEVDTFKDQQELLNDLSNQNTDAITFNLNQMYTLDPESADMIEQIENLPGAVYPLKAGQLQAIPMNAIPANAFNERLNIKNEIRETTATDQILKGAGHQPGMQTATEVQAQVAGAAQRFSIKITQLENEGFHRLARIVFDFIRLYVNKEQAVRVVGKDGVVWKDYIPEEFKTGDYEPRVQLQTTVMSNKVQDANKAKGLLETLIPDPSVNKQELYKIVLPKLFDLDPDEISALFTPGQEQQAAAAASAADAEPQHDPIREYADITKIYSAAGTPEDIKRQIEQLLGLQPSQLPISAADGTTMVPADHPNAMPHDVMNEHLLTTPSPEQLKAEAMQAQSAPQADTQEVPQEMQVAQ